MSKAIKIATMLAVYLVWICGNPIIALDCYAHQDQHVHCCSKCECHHEGCEKTHVETPHGCHHDHSNHIALYDTAKKDNINYEPIVLNITAQIEDNIAIEDVITHHTARHYERGVPLPLPPTLSRCGMRGPPVIA